jgi:LmbE family N-acetylglucosaminyl deacetylase
MNILIAAAHPDDEVLGLGASIARWVREGHRVSVRFFTDGVGARGRNAAAAKARRKAARTAADILGFAIADFGEFPDNQLDRVPLLRLIQAIEATRDRVRPDRVLTHFWGDLNIDHRRVFEAVLTAFRPQPAEPCREIHCFEVASATEWGSPADPFRPSVYTEVSALDVERAARAYAAYGGETRPDPHIRSLESFRARRLLRGREVGLPWAEGLVLGRQIDRLD